MEVFPGTQLTRNIEVRMRLTMMHLVKKRLTMMHLVNMRLTMMHLMKMAILPNRMNFRKISKGGGGFIFNPKIYIADFGNFE